MGTEKCVLRIGDIGEPKYPVVTFSKIDNKENLPVLCSVRPVVLKMSSLVLIDSDGGNDGD